MEVGIGFEPTGCATGIFPKIMTTMFLNICPKFVFALYSEPRYEDQQLPLGTDQMVLVEGFEPSITR